MAKQRKAGLTREEVEARIGVRQEKTSARRANKLKGEDVAVMLAERRQARQERAVPGRGARRASIALGSALVAGTLVLGLVGLETSADLEAATRTNDERTGALRAELRDLPGAGDQSAQAYADELAASIERATTRAEEVASLQDEFSRILFAGNGEQAQDGAASPAFVASVEHRRDLAPYFVERALLVEDDLAYSPGSFVPFDADQIDPRFPWYVAYDPGSGGEVVLDPARSSWSVASVVASQTPGVLEATWLNTAADGGGLLAWATASYYAETETFGSLTLGYTTVGARDLPLDETDGA